MNNPGERSRQNLTANIKAAGCAAKISALELQQMMIGLPAVSDANLLTGIDSFEDAAVYRLSPELALVQTVDFFPPVIDDAYLFGKIAAANALSDVYAMGATPAFALNVFGFPTCDLSLDLAQEILKGGASQMAEAGCAIAGGHSIQSEQVLYGLCVTGFVHPSRILTNAGARAGDRIILSKPIGTGVALLALKGGVLSESGRQELIANLISLNKTCRDVAVANEVMAATDVTGFGLIGHLHEMAKASTLQAGVWASSVPILKEVRELAAMGIVPGAAYANRKSYALLARTESGLDMALEDLLYDPQTSGGLLLAVDPMSSRKVLQELQAAGMTAAIIGEFASGEAGAVEVHADEYPNN